MQVITENGTVGETDSATIGEESTVRLHDENGNPIEITDIIVEVI